MIKSKQFLILLVSIVSVACAMVACCNTGKINNAEIDYESTAKFSEAEIESAVDAVLIKFTGFLGCDLKRLWYDEVRSDEIIQRDISSNGRNTIKNSRAEPENIMILFSNFKTSKSSVAIGANPNAEYADWMWILIKESESDEWNVVDWGY